MPLPAIDPPLLNSASPWATSQSDLQQLYSCSHTGAITTRTCLLDGFAHDDAVHQYTFFDATTNERSTKGLASLNTLGYSPLSLSQYLNMISHIAHAKPCIISVTGSAEAVAQCHRQISELQVDALLCMEVNLSCPNIPDRPPPAYSKSSLLEYLGALRKNHVPIGLKTPPYTYHDQFTTLIEAIVESGCPIDFITATNTLGSSLVLQNLSPAINSASGAGIGGMAGASLHPLALGNVKILRSMLDDHGLQSVDIIGVGGVSDKASFERMRAAGAKAVAVATALGSEGIYVFRKILSGGNDHMLDASSDEHALAVHI